MTIKSEQFLPSHSNGVFSLPFRVYNQDIDAGRVVFVANYLKFMERARTEWLHAIGVNQRYMERELRAVFVVRDIEARYLKPAYLDDLLHSTVEVEELGRSSIGLRQTVRRNDTLLCTARITAVCVHVVKFRAVAIPEDIHQRFESERQQVLDNKMHAEAEARLEDAF